jgi:hypothetical protein
VVILYTGFYIYGLRTVYLEDGKLKKSIVLILLCVGVIVTDSKADMEFINPNRSVSAHNNKGSSESKSTPDFGRFNQSAAISWDSGWGNYYAGQFQDSTITSHSLTAAGFLYDDHDTFEFFSYEPLIQYSSSSLQVEFTTDSPCEVDLTGDLRYAFDYGGTDKGYPRILITLSGQNGEIFSIDFQPTTYGYAIPTEKQINETFLLDRGRYKFSLNAETEGYYSRAGDDPGTGGSGDAFYNIVLTPEPCTPGLLVLGGLTVARRRR